MRRFSRVSLSGLIGSEASMEPIPVPRVKLATGLFGGWRMCTVARTSDGEVNQLLGMEKAFEKVVALAGKDDKLHHRLRARFPIAADEFCGVFCQGYHFVHIAMDKRGGNAGPGKHFDAGNWI